MRNIVGEDNPRWNGGTSAYPNHALMKKNRLIKLRESGGKCEVCGKRASYIHHLDESKDNHAMDNLAVVCSKCHSILHSIDNGRRPSTKFSRLYGMTMREMAEQFGGTSQTYRNLHLRGELVNFLAEKKSAQTS